ncbi:9062_t:CDS:2 [Ambispora gerdemannii]|uniref:9062_t:CDS:1 n=1 Tax=Ambispora gerdemannii TaxID=144530 RepID=A0A9N9BFJ0_9GLOM|nr:9062_t:CDS:2 [Ambispora gerdemannii]
MKLEHDMEEIKKQKQIITNALSAIYSLFTITINSTDVSSFDTDMLAQSAEPKSIQDDEAVGFAAL